MKYGILVPFVLWGLFITTPLHAKSLDGVFTHEDTLSYVGYEVRRCYDSQKGMWFATLEKEGKVLATFKNDGYRKEMNNFGLFPFLGTKVKQLVIEQYSGGAHCCWSYWILKLGPDLDVIYESQEYPVGYGLTPLDLDQDGVFEFTQALLTFDYFDRLPHALSPLPAVVFKYEEKNSRYLPANQIFANYLLNGIEEDTERVREFQKKTDLTTCDDARGEYLSLVFEVVLRYIYAGKEKEGWLFYEKEYHLPDREEMRSKIKKKLESCPVYREIYAPREKRG